MGIRFKFFYFLLLLPVLLFGQEKELQTIKDLKDEWKVFSEKQYVPFDENVEADSRAIYFSLDPGRYPNSFLEVRSPNSFSLFLNHRLFILRENAVRINLDSLKKVSAPPWLFSVYQRDGLSWLNTEIVSLRTPELNSNSIRSGYFFLDFSILVSIALFLFFVVLLRTNPRLTLDYLNVVRLFSILEREDTLLNSRISSSVNILYYGFSSLLAAFILLIIFHFGGREIAIAEYFTVDSMSEGFLQWIKLSFIVMAALIAKLILLLILARLFDSKENTAIQFYNYMRLLFFTFGLAAIVCVCYFVFKIQNPEAYSFLVNCIISLLIVWVFIVGLKLLRRSSFRFFHLFSYLCASELIPIVIMIKVLNS